MNEFTKEMLEKGGDEYSWEIIESDLDTVSLDALPIDPNNGYDILDFINSFAPEILLTAEQKKSIELLLHRKIPLVNESRAELRRYFIAHLDEMQR